ncbi:MAG: 1-acyl-sn-glycerol-3-phosphate acyltransferase [Bacteroidales bacterium]|nr:1-acyl-sn-glycerol-3-phosphate acyltransferase [Bacteroidales bacterium]
MSLSDFGDIRPYTDEEAVEALGRVSRHPMTPVISKYLFPDLPASTMSHMLRGIGSVDQFQNEIMFAVVAAVAAKTSAGVTWAGQEHLKALDGRKFLMISNHRDIVLDPALIQFMLKQEGLPTTEICVGSNLLGSQLVEDLMRSNRMIKVIRGVGPRELYRSSQVLSQYIRESITSGHASIWIAQREGRTKDGLDTTEQGLLKMLEMSGEGSFEQNFLDLRIVPLSISYEYESCDARKAREVLLRREGPYVKKEKEDLHSILTGIRQQKGRIHLEVGEPLRADEVAAAASADRNERYQALRATLDRRIVGGYHLWKTNYMADDLLGGTTRWAEAGKYTPAELDAFEKYIAHKLGKLERRLDRQALREIFLGIYAGPVQAKERL